MAELINFIGKVGFVATCVVAIGVVFLERWQPGFAVSAVDPIWVVVLGLCFIGMATYDVEVSSDK